MTILSGQNGSGGFFPQQRADRAIEGTPGEGRLPFARTATNPILAQLDTALIGGTATDGSYIVGVTDPKGLRTEAVVVRTGGAPASNADLATAMAAAINLSMVGIASAVVDGGTPELVNITFEHAGIPYVLDQSAPAPGTIALANTQQSGGVAQSLARFVERGAADQSGNPLVLPVSPSTTDDNLFGISIRPIGEFAGVEPGPGINPQDPNQPDVVPAGNSLSVAYEGAINMKNNGTVAAVPGGPVFIVVNAAGGQQVGQARANADGGNTFAASQLQTKWIDPVLPGEIGRLFVRYI